MMMCSPLFSEQHKGGEKKRHQYSTEKGRRASQSLDWVTDHQQAVSLNVTRKCHIVLVKKGTVKTSGSFFFFFWRLPSWNNFHFVKYVQSGKFQNLKKHNNMSFTQFDAANTKIATIIKHDQTALGWSSAVLVVVAKHLISWHYWFI